VIGRQWAVHKLSGVPEPHEIHWLIDRLTAINRIGSGAVLQHAYKIHGVWLGLQGRDDHKGYKVRGKTRLRAERVKATRGAWNDLDRLRTAAKSDSPKIFQKAWLGVAGNTRRLVLQPTPPLVERKLDQDGKLIGFRRERFDASKLIPVKAGRFYSLIPGATDALPLIEAAIHKLGPAVERRKRKRDDLAAIEHELATAVRIAYRELTGQTGYTWNDKEHKHEGPLIDLWREIDAHFGTEIFSVYRLRLKSRKATGA
jgi:hypothetical protein